ncbi:hypothetical protein [Leptolyngbya sp. FACHB-261]|uniref:hypothetical protein n=1 Tax=Leptolyngbya sp. FACHB-261 TaxID=2692806 RepID=UPI0016821FE0|nr:hypothetical protein [Leptolyngbya sp. FACHB-261]MBD2103113.1 hypothetical protein [Leptolyngbya sp. FACHB-261]
MFSFNHALQVAVSSLVLAAAVGIPAQAALISGRISGTVTRVEGLPQLPEGIKLGSLIQGTYSYDTDQLLDGIPQSKVITAFNLSIGDNPFNFDLSTLDPSSSVDIGAGTGGTDLVRAFFRGDAVSQFIFGVDQEPTSFGSLFASPVNGNGFLSLASGRGDFFGYVESDNIVAGSDVPAIPVPGLAPGLVGLGVAWSRRRRLQKAEATR